MTNEKDKQTKKTKHHGSQKRPNRLEITFSDGEWNIVLSQADEAGYAKPTEFARKLLLGGGTIQAVVTPEDRKNIGQLSKIGTNLWQLRKDLNYYGLDKKFLEDLNTFHANFKKVILFYRAKIDK